MSYEKSLTLAANTNDQVLFESHPNDSRVTGPVSVAPTVSAQFGTGGNNTPLVLNNQGATPGVVYGIAGNVIDRQVQNGGNGVGVQENISYTLNTIDRHAVCIGNGQVAQARIQEKVGALNCMHDQQAVMQSLAVDGKNFVEANVNGPLMSSAEHNIESNNVVRQRYAVRRLTPLECERLQGLPDGYTLIDDKSCSDSARYKALGNGMAQPCADFVLRRLVEEVEKEAT